MANKAFYIIYNVSDAQNTLIAASDNDGFFKKMQAALSTVMDVQNPIKIETSAELLGALTTISAKRAYQEIYLHFSTHGQAAGINFGKWLVENDDFAKILATDKRIKFCFFGSCLSDELAKKVAVHIPVAIGTLTEIENDFAIEFQKKFYELLLDVEKKNTFQTAFEGSLTFMKERDNFRAKIENGNLDNGKPITRGGLDPDAFVLPKLNEIQLFFKEESDKNAYLIYPTIVDEINALPESKTVLMVYANSENALEAFQKIYEAEGKNEIARLLPLTTENLPALKSDQGEMLLMTRENLKVLLILHNEQDLAAEFINVFDRQRIEIMPNLKVKVAYEKTVDWQKILSNTSFFKAVEKIKFEDLVSLEDSDSFFNLISESSISYSDRKNYTFKFPCSPTKRNILDVDVDETSLCVFYFPNSMQRLGNFLINYVKSFIIENLRYPYLKIHGEFENKDDNTDLKNILKGKIFQYLSENTDHRRNRTFEKLVEAIAGMEDSIIIIWELNENDKKEEIEDCLKDFVESFKSGIEGFEEFNDAPTYLFVFYPDEHKGQLFSQNESRVFADFAITPEPIEEQIKSWKRRFEDEKKSHRDKIGEIIKTIEDRELSDLPTAIEAICEGFKIPHKNFLYIS